VQYLVIALKGLLLALPLFIAIAVSISLLRRTWQQRKRSRNERLVERRFRADYPNKLLIGVETVSQEQEREVLVALFSRTKPPMQQYYVVATGSDRAEELRDDATYRAELRARL